MLYQLSYSRLGGLCLQHFQILERETRLELATPTLEGRALPTELFPLNLRLSNRYALAAFTHLSHLLL